MKARERYRYKLSGGAAGEGAVVQVIGRRSENTRPYLRVATEHGFYVGSLDGRQLRALYDAIGRALA